MQDPSKKKEETVKLTENNINKPEPEQPITPITDDIEEKDQDYLFLDMIGGEG